MLDAPIAPLLARMGRPNMLMMLVGHRRGSWVLVGCPLATVAYAVCRRHQATAGGARL